ncbi:hypothetical protein [Sinobaca sp. H24]|uniref:hypothetical protein n=1 Tax=Sinobaca sp. H24 TaxID=2923376 RepID=UPI0020797A2A|nr:hypothetical protein [Sinobaca sp. H24]
MIEEKRYRVVIRCPQCGEKFVLKGSRKEDGTIQTGFVRCICGNSSRLYVDTAPE